MQIDSRAEHRRSTSPATKNEFRVLAVIPGGESAGFFSMAKRQVAVIREMGIDIRTFFVSFRSSLLSLAQQWAELRHEVAQFRPDVIHAHFGTVTAFLSAISGTTPLVITFRGSDLHGDPDLKPLHSYLGRLLSHFSCLRATRIICVSDQLRDCLWWKKSCACTIPTGTDLEFFRPQSKEQARTMLGWSMSERVVLFNGKHHPRTKGLPLVQAAVAFAENIVGPIRVELLDAPFEMVPWYLNASDCLAMASLSEGSPNIVKEALACNLPIVSVDVGDVAQRLKNVHPSGIVARDPVDFGTALAGILRNPCSSNGRLHGRLCSEADTAAAIVRTYRAVNEQRWNMSASISDRTQLQP